MPYSKQLKLHYKQEGDSITFEDGCVYSIGEAVFMSRRNIASEDFQKLHLIKRVFQGQIEGVIKREPIFTEDLLGALGKKLGRPPFVIK